MLPIYLSLEGLYSYQKKQEVDFTQLTEGGLFGIFGSVGSGKSSILEAISFALYGETERLNKQEKRAYNMLNLKSDTAIIDFHFINFEGRKFRFVAQWRRKKKFEETTSIERYAYEWQEDNWLPLESADGAKVTNLSYPNFRRTIIIPQGQFMEFLELKGKDRSDMMKEIFFLNQYDLGPRVGYLQSENNKKVEHIKGALTGFEEVSGEIITAHSLALDEGKINLEKVKVEFEQLEKQLHRLRAEQENKTDLLQKEQERAVLEEQRPRIRHYEEQLQQFETVSLHFREPINNLHHITSNKEQLLGKIEKLKDNKQLLNQKISDTEQQLAGIQADYVLLPNYKMQVDDLQLLITHADFEKNLLELQQRVEKGTPIVMQTAQKEKELTGQLQTAEVQLEQLKGKRTPTQELIAIETWYQQHEKLQSQQSDNQEKIQQQAQEIASYHAQLHAHDLSETNWREVLEARINKIAERSNQLKDKENNVLVKQELAQYVLKLHQGEPCPLCGSLEHPAPMHDENWNVEMAQLHNERAQLTLKEQQLRELQAQAATISTLLGEKVKSQTALEAQLKELAQLIHTHGSKFIWADFDKGDRAAFEATKKQVQHLEEQIVQRENGIKTIRKALQETQDNRAKYEKSLDELRNQTKIVEAKMAQQLQQLKAIEPTACRSKDKDQLLAESTRIQETIKQVEQQYSSWTEVLIRTKTQYAENVSQYAEAHEQYSALNSQHHTLQGTINKLLKEFAFGDITVVKSILDKNLDVASLREKIQQFYLLHNSLSTRIQELKELTKDSTFTQKVFEELVAIHQLKKEELELQFSITGALEKELARLTIELDKKNNLLEEYEQLQTRKENLKVLDNMFKGNGFINYVSSIHLARLCELANQRFHRLTKNQLSLCLNESNEFEVIDYLHDGNQRSVKTLSGGQSFQASLCLALALAENIQSLNKADKNFFFIDEGFGTQDAESINTVFDTLQYLQHENRVVGIISHVDELKERMPRSITVTKDLEKGSQISYN